MNEDEEEVRSSPLSSFALLNVRTPLPAPPSQTNINPQPFPQPSAQYDFEYSDDSGSNSSNSSVENSYYNAKGLKDDSLPSACTAFLKVVIDEESGEKTVWGFKCLKQLIKCHYAQGEYSKMVEVRAL